MPLQDVKRSIAILGNYLPRRCGIATFTTDLSEAIFGEVGPHLDLNVIAMTNRPEGYKYPERVKTEIRRSSSSTLRRIARRTSRSPSPRGTFASLPLRNSKRRRTFGTISDSVPSESR